MQAPFDPLQLLKALSSLLSTQGGIKSDNEVPRLSSLMKKFSKKLVSRCIYVHVLISTTPDVLTKFLDQDGWNTINAWLQEAKEASNWPFTVELLRLCEALPMTVERLKENNTAKLVKSLTKVEHDEIKRLSIKVVTTWMKLITGASKDLVVTDKTEKVKKRKRKDKDVKVEKNEEPEEDWLKKGRKNRSSGHSSVPIERKRSHEDQNLEDVEIQVPKTNSIDKEIDKLRESRPKTVKTFHARFRSTGLIEENPLPKPVSKKKPTVDSNAALVAAKAAKRRSISPLGYSEKKLKPSSLITPASESSSSQGGIKLIPAKPRPVHVLHESAGFMDALVTITSQPVRKKKKGNGPQAAGSKTPTSPTSPTLAPPKLQFYKDTLELGDNDNKDDTEKSDDSKIKDDVEGGNNDKEKSSDNEDDDKDKSGESTDCESEKAETNTESQDDDEGEQTSQTSKSSGEVRSILSIVKRKGKKKSVKWRDDKNLKEFFYFELDETERVNVNNVKDFGEMKSFEMKRERAAFESAKRIMSDKMNEATPWRGLKPVDLVPAIVEPGWNSKEKEIQKQRHQSKLQEIYFSKDMIPDSPAEPEQESHLSTDPIIIPLDDMNNPSALMDYSSLDLPPPKPALPPVLATLMMSITGQQFPVGAEMLAGQLNEMGMPIDGMPPGTNGPLGGPGFPQVPAVTQEIWTGAAPEWPTTIENKPPEGFFPANPGLMGPGPMGPGVPPMHPNFPGNMAFNRPPNMRPPFLGGMSDNRLNGPRMNHGGPNGNRRFPTTPCKHFMNGTCRFGPGCKFLHPGINGPAL